MSEASTGRTRLGATARATRCRARKDGTGPHPDRTSYASYATFGDPDGNGWVLQEIAERQPGR
jgi:hypothetical protein